MAIFGPNFTCQFYNFFKAYFQRVLRPRKFNYMFFLNDTGKNFGQFSFEWCLVQVDLSKSKETVDHILNENILTYSNI